MPVEVNKLLSSPPSFTENENLTKLSQLSLSGASGQYLRVNSTEDNFETQQLQFQNKVLDWRNVDFANNRLGYPNGNIAGNAISEYSGSRIRLTNAVNGQFGFVRWDNVNLSAPRLKFSFECYAGGGNGADESAIFWQGDIAVGYTVIIREYTGAGTQGIELLYGGVFLGRTVIPIAQNVWNPITIYQFDNFITVSYYDEINFTYNDIVRPRVNTVGFYAITGGANNVHYVRKLLIEEV